MLAIDFGTSRVKVAYLNDGVATLAPLGVGGQSFIPSLFYISREGDVDIGDDAAAWLSDDPKGVVETLKRKLRENFIRKNRQKKKPQELIRRLFTQIRDRCHDELEHIFSEPPTAVTLTYPARYSDVEKNILRSAAMEAGFTEINLISEPEAAALAWQHKAGRLSSDVLVVLDCGGGTADWACLKVNDGKLRLFSELPPGGDENIGGHDIDEELLTLVRDHFEEEDNDDALELMREKQTDILNQLRSVKEKYSRRGRLTSSDVVRVGRNKVAITQEMLEGAFESKIIRDLVTNFSQYLAQVKEHTGEDNPIVLLVGGTGQLRGLPEALTKRCNVSVKKWMESEFATVQGALYWNADIQASVPAETMQRSMEQQTEDTQRLQDELAVQKLEEERKAEKARQAEELRVAEEAKRAEEEKAQKKREEEAKKAEELRLLEEKQKAEEARKEKEARLADEQQKQAEAKQIQEANDKQSQEKEPSSSPSVQKPAKKSNPIPIIGLIGCSFVAFLLILAIAIPNFVAMQYKSKRAEIPQNLRAIKTAQIAYENEFDVYVKCAAYPFYPTKMPQQWIRSSSGGFQTIDFYPDGDVRGSYMVSTTATNFTAIGISDVDGDGVEATYTATKSENPNSPITAPDVY